MFATQIYARRLVGSIIRYGVTGLAISIVYSAGVVLLVALMGSESATLASVLAFIAVAPIAYAAHRYITFFDASRDAWQPLRYAVTTTSSFLVTTVGMYVVTEVLGRSYLMGVALNWALIPAMNFVIYFIWVFRAGTLPVAAEAGAAAVSPRGARMEYRP
jgi:putative flippase GtrA